MKCRLGNILSVNSYTSTVGIVEAAQKIDDRGLACTGRTHNGNRLSLIHMKADVLQDRDAILITESNMIKVYRALDLRHLHCVRCIRYFHRLINGLKDTLQIGDCRQNAVIKSGNGIDRLPESGNICRKHHKHTDRHTGSAASKNTWYTHHIYKGCGDHRDQIHHRTHHKVIINCFEPCFPVTHAQRIKDLDIFLLPDKCLGNTDTVNTLRNIGIEIGLLIALELPAGTLFSL